jgi:hypothetical protein
LKAHLDARLFATRTFCERAGAMDSYKPPLCLTR